jgi:hypothetical protein
MQKLILTLTALASLTMASYGYSLPSRADVAYEELITEFDIPSHESITAFEVSGVPVERAYIAWKTGYWDAYGVWIPVYHHRTFDFSTHIVVRRSDF